MLERIRKASQENRDRFERLFMDLTRAELEGYTDFDMDNGFTPPSLPSPR